MMFTRCRSMASRDRAASNTSRTMAVPPQNSVDMQRFRLPADMRGRQVHQQPCALAEAEGRAQAQVLAGDVAVRKQGRLGAAGGTGGEDRLRRVFFSTAAAAWSYSAAAPGAWDARCAKDRAPSMVSDRGRNWIRCSTEEHSPVTACPTSRKSAAGVFPRNAYPLGWTGPRSGGPPAGRSRRSSGVWMTPILKQAYSRKMCPVRNGREAAR